MLELYQQKYREGSLFNVIRSLTYFMDAEENVMPEMLIPIQWENVKSVIRFTVAQYD
jgi:hypothetical protein